MARPFPTLMANKFTRTIELTTNIAIIIVAILLGVVLVKNYFLAGPKTDPNVPPTVPVGTKISLQDVNWAAKKRTLLMALSDTCRYCTESADFYKKLAQEKAKHDDVRIIAVLPQDLSAGQAYLKKLGVTVDEVRQSPLEAVGVKATPTLVLIDDKGVVTASWVGKLPAEKETEVINQFLMNQATRLYDPKRATTF